MSKYRKSTFIMTVVLVLLTGGIVTKVYSHCQMPCGIYDDDARLKAINESIVTIEKAMKQITALSDTDRPNMNQIVRWVNTKETHVDELSETVTGYFMAQRVKPAAPDSPEYDKYIKQLTLLHQMLIEAMKCKQTSDPAHTENLRSLLDQFTQAYTK